MAENATLTPEQIEEKKKQILALTAKKHVKIWLLHEVCLLKNKEIGVLVDSNAGVIGNSLKAYNLEPNKIEEARKFLSE